MLLKRFSLLPLLFSCIAWISIANSQTLNIPWQESFATDQLDPGWRTMISAGAKLTVKDGWATFDSGANSRAHLERATGVDDITISAKVVRWGGIYLVWDAENWCGVGKLSPTPFGRFYSIEVEHGQPREVNHRNVDFNLPHLIRIALGENYVRFEYKQGEQWLPLRTIERPKSFSGPPQVLAVGKYYGAGQKQFGQPGTGAGDPIGGVIGDLRVERTRNLRLDQAEVEALHRPAIDPIKALLENSDGDPTFEQVAQCYPPMKSPREVVGVPWHNLDIGVDYLGRLDVTPWGAPVAWFEFGAPGKPFGEQGIDNGAYFTWDRSAAVSLPRGTAVFKRRLLHGWLPIITLSRTMDGVDCELTVFGWSEGFSPEKPLQAYVCLAAHCSETNRLPAVASVLWANGGKRSFALERAGDWARCCFRCKHPDPASATAVTSDEFELRKAETAAFWTRKFEPAMRFDLPDERVMNGYRAWLVYSMLNSDFINGNVEPHDGAGFYEEMFGNSVSLHSMALDMYGFHQGAARVLETQIHYQQPDGLYTQACGLVDPGGFLAGLARHFQITGDAEWLRRVSTNMISQCEWLIRQRDAAPKDGNLRGLIKFRPYNDYPDPVYNYLGNAWCAHGMQMSADALTEIQFPKSQKYAQVAQAYRADILDSMEASVIRSGGTAVLPMEPDTHRLLKLSNHRAGDYYGLIASPLLGIGLLPPQDQRTRWMTQFLEEQGGLMAGVCEFEGGIDHAYTYGYLMNALQRGNARKALLGFWSFMAFGMTRDTYSPVEVTMHLTGENHFTLPHLYSCTEQLRLLRNFLLREEDGELWIGQGIPRAWLEPGKHVAVSAAPTEFGPVSYKIQAQANGDLLIHLDPPLRRTPGRINLSLRPPGKRRIARVEGAANCAMEPEKELIRVRGLRAPVDLLVHLQ